MKFLIVDDVSVMRRTISNSLKELGAISYKEAENGEKALQMLKSEHFDFVLTEYNMPVMNGLELTNAIRADHRFNNVSVLMISAEAKKENVLAAAEAGIDDYIVKPFNAKVLTDKFQKLIHKKDMFKAPKMKM